MAREIIDFHMHPFTCKAQSICSYDLDVTPEGIGDDLSRAGITRFCGSVVQRGVSTMEQIRILNRSALQLRDLYGDRYTPGIHIHPDFVRESCEELQYMYANGVRLIGELVPYMMGWKRYTCPGALEIFSYAQDLGMTVSIHPTSDDDMFTLYRAFPKMNFVAAHPGERDAYMLHLERMQACPNAYLDVCGTGLFRNRMLRYGVNLLGAERFLFGTDYPVCNPGMQVQGVEWELERTCDQDAVFSGNAKRLLGL